MCKVSIDFPEEGFQTHFEAFTITTLDVIPAAACPGLVPGCRNLIPCVISQEIPG